MRRDHDDGVDRPRAVVLERLPESDLVADREVAERDGVAAPGVRRAAVDGDRSRPAIGRLERDARAGDRRDADAAETMPRAAAAAGAAGAAAEAVQALYSRAPVAGRPGGERARARLRTR